MGFDYDIPPSFYDVDKGYCKSCDDVLHEGNINSADEKFCENCSAGHYVDELAYKLEDPINTDTEHLISEIQTYHDCDDYPADEYIADLLETRKTKQL